MNIPNVKDIVIPAKHCPHYVTASYVQWYGAEWCAGCFINPTTPNSQARSGPPSKKR